MTNTERLRRWRLRYFTSGRVWNGRAHDAQSIRGVDWSCRNADGRIRLRLDGFLPRNAVPAHILEVLR